MTTTPAQARYLAAEDAVAEHIATCRDCASGDMCPAGFARIQAESVTWEAVKAADPRFAADYDRACIRQAA